MILVVWCTSTGSGARLRVQDHWRGFDCPNEAGQFYLRIRERAETYNANICGVIESTDFEPITQKKAGAVRRELTRGVL